MNKEYKGLEMQFCENWEGWDELDTFSLQFTGVTLTDEVAALVGQKNVDCMTVSGDNSTVEIVKSWDDSEILRFELVATLKKIVDKDE